jgi:hypothetical protein
MDGRITKSVIFSTIYSYICNTAKFHAKISLVPSRFFEKPNFRYHKIEGKKTLAPRLKKGPSNPRTPLPSILQFSNYRAPYPGPLILRIVTSAQYESLKNYFSH